MPRREDAPPASRARVLFDVAPLGRQFGELVREQMFGEWESSKGQEDGCKGAALHMAGHHDGAGFAALFQLWALTFMEAVEEREVFAYSTQVAWQYAGPTCGDRRALCFFEAPSRCPLAARPTKMKNRKGKQPYLDSVPASLRAAGMDYHLWFALVQQYLAQPRPAELARLDALKWALGWPAAGEEPVLAIHVRHGDRAAVHGDKHRPLEQYMVHARALRARFGVTAVFVSSDDPAVIRALREHTPEGFRFMFVEDELRATGMVKFLKQQAAEGAVTADNDLKTRAGRDIISAIHLMAEANFLVCTCMSQVGRVTASLQYARGHQLAPPIALDFKQVTSPMHFIPLEEKWVKEASSWEEAGVSAPYRASWEAGGYGSWGSVWV